MTLAAGKTMYKHYCDIRRGVFNSSCKIILKCCFTVYQVALRTHCCQNENSSPYCHHLPVLGMTWLQREVHQPAGHYENSTARKKQIPLTSPKSAAFGEVRRSMGDLLNANCVKFLELPLSIWTILEEQKEKKIHPTTNIFLGGGMQF